MLKKSFDDIFSGLTPAEEKYFLCIGGGTCAGKWTISKAFHDNGIIDRDSTLVINGELFADLLPGYEKYQHQRHPEKKPELLENFRLARFMLINEAIKRGISVLLDDHMDDLVEIQDLVQLAKLHHYQTCLAGSVIEPEDILPLQEARKKRSGVEPSSKKDCLQWHKSFAQNFPLFKKGFDEVFLYYYKQEPETTDLVHTLMFLKTGEQEEVFRPDLIGVLDELSKINVNATTSKEVISGANPQPWQFDPVPSIRRNGIIRQRTPKNSWQSRVLEECLTGGLNSVREVIR